MLKLNADLQQLRDAIVSTWCRNCSSTHTMKTWGCSESKSSPNKVAGQCLCPLQGHVRDRKACCCCVFFLILSCALCDSWSPKLSCGVCRTWWNLQAVKRKRRLHSFRRLTEKFSEQQVSSCPSAHSWHEDKETRGTRTWRNTDDPTSLQTLISVGSSPAHFIMRFNSDTWYWNGGCELYITYYIHQLYQPHQAGTENKEETEMSWLINEIWQKQEVSRFVQTSFKSGNVSS